MVRWCLEANVNKELALPVLVKSFKVDELLLLLLLCSFDGAHGMGKVRVKS